MQKQAPTLGRLLVMVGFALSCFGLLLFLWLAFGGPVPLKPKGYRFQVSFSEGTQLAKEADVRISGVSVGKVKDIIPNGKTGRSDATIEMDADYAPVPKDSKAILRQKTLLGETYVELAPGHKSVGTIPENGKLANARVSPTVELDEIFRAFDSKTREGFQQWMQGLAVAVNGRGRDINDALGNLAPFARDTNELLTVLNSQDATVRRLVRNTGDVFTALSERDGELTQLISNSNRVFATTAARNEDIKATFIALPTFNREASKTVRRLSTFAQQTNPLVTQLRPAARELSPTLIDLTALAPDLEALFTDLGPLIKAGEKGLPATEQFLDELHPFLGSLDPVLRQVNPILSFIGPYKSELSAFFANTVGATQATTPGRGEGAARIHYLRTTNPANPENLAVYPRRLISNRPNPYPHPRAFDQLDKGGMPVYEDRQCTSGPAPTIVDNTVLANPVLSALVPQALADNIKKFFFQTTSGSVPSPPCRKQAPFTVQGTTTQYPQVKPSTGATARRRGK
jgi:virulence factor Mce-like protein